VNSSSSALLGFLGFGFLVVIVERGSGHAAAGFVQNDEGHLLAQRIEIQRDREWDDVVRERRLGQGER
jgi:hypothetical protein